MTVDYNKFAKTFANSRLNLKWEEIEYFLTFLEWKKDLKVLDVWCGSWRLLGEFAKNEIDLWEYLWVDLSTWLLDEAKKKYPEIEFMELNMLDLNKVEKTYDMIFFVASFHHINNPDDRLRVIKKAYNMLEDGWMMFFTNWALDSDLNRMRYWRNKVAWSENRFWSSDFNIKIWEFVRYYHSFHLDELKYLFEKTWFDIIENREFDNKRNLVSIVKKVWEE